MNLDFLKELELPEPEKAKSGIKKVELQGDFRIYRNGTFEWSKEDHYAELIFSDDLFGYPSDKPKLLFLHTSTEKFPKFDFETSKKSTFLKKNFNRIAEFFGLDGENTAFIDFNILDEVTFPKAFVGKVVSKGMKKGQLTYVERENITLFPIINVYPVTEGKIDDEMEIKTEGDPNWVKDTSIDLRDGI